jgi:hypothetical protein
MAESSGDISNPQGSQGQGPSELVRGPDWSEARGATARSQKLAEERGRSPNREPLRLGLAGGKAQTRMAERVGFSPKLLKSLTEIA